MGPEISSQISYSCRSLHFNSHWVSGSAKGYGRAFGDIDVICFSRPTVPIGQCLPAAWHSQTHSLFLERISQHRKIESLRQQRLGFAGAVITTTDLNLQVSAPPPSFRTGTSRVFFSTIRKSFRLYRQVNISGIVYNTCQQSAHVKNNPT